MTRHGRPLCPECDTPMVPTLRGFACPRLGSCGRSGVEERGERVRRAGPEGGPATRARA